MSRSKNGDPSGLMAKIPEDMFTRQQVADLIGRSKDTVRRWHISGIYQATKGIQIGDAYVFLYDNDDVLAMKKLARNKRVRKPEKGT